MILSRRKLIVAVCLMACHESVSYGESEPTGRLRMTAPPEGQEVAEQLMESLASACNSKDFIAFMGHFTAKQSAVVRRRLEDAFTVHDLAVDIKSVVLLSEGDEEIIFGVRYEWGPKAEPHHLVASRVTARKVDGKWKLDRERVKSLSVSDTSSSTSRRSECFGFGGGVEVAFVRDDVKPRADLIDPNQEHLRGDTGIRPGRGCADGRCTVR